jgi:hypothetical protein
VSRSSDRTPARWCRGLLLVSQVVSNLAGDAIHHGRCAGLVHADRASLAHVRLRSQSGNEIRQRASRELDGGRCWALGGSDRLSV